MVVGPGVFETVSEDIDGRPAEGGPDEKTYGRGTEATHCKEKTFHDLLTSTRMPIRTTLPILMGWMQEMGLGFFGAYKTFAGDTKRLHSGYGSGSFWASAGDGDAAGGEDGGLGDRCGDGSES